MKISKNISTLSGWTELEYKDYTLQLKAKAVGYYDSVLSSSVIYSKRHRLDSPTNLTVNSLTLSFDVVQSATEYDIYIDDNKFDTIQSNSVYLGSCINFVNLSSGAHTVYVTAHANDYNDSLKSSEVTFVITPCLNAPLNLSINGNLLTFSKVVNAESYSIYLNNSLFAIVPISNTSSTNEVIDISNLIEYTTLNSGSYILNITASATGYETSSKSRSVIYKKLYKLSTPRILNIENNQLIFAQVDNASSYKIYVNNAVYGTSSGVSYTNNEVAVLIDNPLLNTDINTNINFTSNLTNYDTFIVNQGVNICYGTSENQVYDTSTGIWSDANFKIIHFDEAAGAPLWNWVSSNSVSQIRIDLSSFISYQSLASGYYNVNIVAEGYGFESSDHSNNMVWARLDTLGAPVLSLDEENHNILYINDIDENSSQYKLYEEGNLLTIINKGNKVINPEGYELTYSGADNEHMKVYINEVLVSLPTESSEVIRTQEGVSTVSWEFDEGSGWNYISVNGIMVYEKYGAGSYTLTLENSTTIIFGIGGAITYTPIQTSYDLNELQLGSGTHTLNAKSSGEDYKDSDFSNSVLYVVAGQPYLTFSSPNSFTLNVIDNLKYWDGTLEYSTDTTTWSTWDGTATLSSASDGIKHSLYLRGTGNTYITGNTASNTKAKWVLTGSDISCNGNIENLLDYGVVSFGQHPTMASYCYRYMFYGCTNLTTAPTLPATTLANYCYYCMFYGCSLLTTAPDLPATTLANGCYKSMFSSCGNLTTPPILAATTLADNCYQSMFSSCGNLTTAPNLPATTLADNCYQSMFSSCGNLTTPPILAAESLAPNCYYAMFSGCSNLASAPALPATTLAAHCYHQMFRSCSSLTIAPTLPALTMAPYCYDEMFYECTSLETAPALPALTLASYCYCYMFGYCTFTTAPNLPATVLADNCYNCMFGYCKNLTALAKIGNGTTKVTSAVRCCQLMYTNAGVHVYTTATDHIPFFRGIAASSSESSPYYRSTWGMFSRCYVDGSFITSASGGWASENVQYYY